KRQKRETMRPHIIHSSEITVTDMFCGAGGSSYGASRVPGVRIYRAMNHWKRAIETHGANFPETEHVLADIQEVSPQYFDRSDILIASPSCTNHSLAKGRKKQQISPQLELPWDGDEFGPPLPLSAEERSRCTMWDPLKWARVHKYNYVI